MSDTPANPFAAVAHSHGKPNATFAEIAAVLRDKQRFVVVSHVRPDGDALAAPLPWA